MLVVENTLEVAFQWFGKNRWKGDVRLQVRSILLARSLTLLGYLGHVHRLCTLQLDDILERGFLDDPIRSGAKLSKFVENAVERASCSSSRISQTHTS